MISTHVANLARLVACDCPDSEAVEKIEGRILAATPSDNADAYAMLAVASAWIMADADPAMQEKAQAAVKRVAAMMGVSGAVAEYYGCGA